MYQGLLVMRKFLLVGIVFAAVLHFMLHIFVQKKTISTFPTDSNKEFKSCYNEKFRLILNVSDIEPFLCEDYRRQSVILGTNRVDLPYGTRKGDRYFDMALKKLPKCDLPDDIRNISCKKCIVVGNGGVLRNSTLGKKIDSYDVIIRVDNAGSPTSGSRAHQTADGCYPKPLF